MKSAYRYLALLIALDVLVQAAAIAYAASGLGRWADDGHQVAKGALADAHFTGLGGFVLHGVNGMVVIPVLGIALVLVALLAKIPGGPRSAGILLLMIVVQVALGIGAASAPILGALHGALALGVFGYAAMIGVRAMLADRTASV